MDIVAFGELLIDFVALEQGVTVGEASGFVKAPGGAPANVAVAAARLGYSAGFLGQVGDDPFGHFLADVLKAEAVDISGLRFSTAARTALAFVSNDAHGDRSFMFYRHPSADMLMTPDDVANDVIQGARVFHHGSITLIDEPVRSATQAAIHTAQETGAIISYDPNLRLALWPSEQAAREGLLLGFETANIVKISSDEVEFLTGSDDIAPLWRDSIDVIVVTYGPQGSRLFTREGMIAQHGGYKVSAVDTTGAGDAFVAALLVQWLEQTDSGKVNYTQLLRRANAVGALATMQKGAIPSLPTRDQVDEFLATQTV